MKMKELKSFLSDRDENCNGCAEKSDWIEAAIRVKDKKISASKAAQMGYTGSLPTEPLWDVWSQFASETAQEMNLDESSIAKIKDVVSDCFMQHGRSTATKLKKTAKDILKTSLKSPYYTIGRKHLLALVNFVRNKGEEVKLNEMRTRYEKIFTPWMTNVGIENTNPMYEWMKSPEHDEL